MIKLLVKFYHSFCRKIIQKSKKIEKNQLIINDEDRDNKTKKQIHFGDRQANKKKKKIKIKQKTLLLLIKHIIIG